MKKTLLPIIMLLIALASLAGCEGGNDDSTSAGGPDVTSGEALSKGAFIAQAGQICDNADAQQAINFEDFKQKNGKKTGSKAEEEALVTEVGLPAIETELEELRALGAPEGDEDEISAILDEVEKAIEETKKKPLSVYTAKNPFEAPEGRAAKYGLKKCGFT